MEGWFSTNSKEQICTCPIPYLRDLKIITMYNEHDSVKIEILEGQLTNHILIHDHLGVTQVILSDLTLDGSNRFVLIDAAVCFGFE